MGNIVQDGDTATLHDEAQRRFQRYCAMLDALTGMESSALLQELPRLINTLPDWAGDFLVGIANGAGTPQASTITCFNTLLAAAPPAEQALIAAFIAADEDDGWFAHCPGVLGTGQG